MSECSCSFRVCDSMCVSGVPGDGLGCFNFLWTLLTDHPSLNNLVVPSEPKRAEGEDGVHG